MSDQTDTVRQIARQLKEPNVPLVALVVEHLGAEAALKFLAQALEVEVQGGMMIEREQRRRTPGGVFFHLVKQGLTPAERAAWWPLPAKRRRAKAPSVKAPPSVPLTREEWRQWVLEARQQPGEATTVKITLVGRPGRIIEKGGVVLTTMESGKSPALSKGLPPPPAEPTTYVVFIAQKQWAKVAAAMQDPEDKLIVEGFPAFEKQLGAMAVYAMQVTTRNMQAAKRTQGEQGADGS